MLCGGQGGKWYCVLLIVNNRLFMEQILNNISSDKKTVNVTGKEYNRMSIPRKVLWRPKQSESNILMSVKVFSFYFKGLGSRLTVWEIRLKTSQMYRDLWLPRWVQPIFKGILPSNKSKTLQLLGVFLKMIQDVNLFKNTKSTLTF